MKSPPEQYSDSDARDKTEAFIAGEDRDGGKAAKGGKAKTVKAEVPRGRRIVARWTGGAGRP